MLKVGPEMSVYGYADIIRILLFDPGILGISFFFFKQHVLHCLGARLQIRQANSIHTNGEVSIALGNTCKLSE